MTALATTAPPEPRAEGTRRKNPIGTARGRARSSLTRWRQTFGKTPIPLSVVADDGRDGDAAD